MPDRAATDRSFAVRMGLLLLTMIALGFGGRAWARGSAAEAGPPLATLLPHVGAVGAWYVLFVLQAAWSGPRRRLHRVAGYLSVPLVVGVLWTGVVVMAANYRLKGDAPLAFFNLLNLGQFAGLYLAALTQVRRPRHHARLMLYASCAMMPPALVRIVQALGLPEPVTVLLIVGLWIPGLRHDRAMLGRVHGATWVGVFVLGAGVALGGPVGFSAAWAALLDGWLGDA